MAAFEIPFRGETKTLDEETRSSVPGEFIELSHGVTHYQIGGPPDGIPVVLVHGFTVPFFMWDPTFEALTQAGFRVLRYDLYGRGYSDRPYATYDHDLFDQQLYDLLEILDFRKPASIFGLSMGGVVAATFTARYPELVDKLALIDPAGFPIKFSFALKLIKIPGLGELLFNIIGSRTLLDGIANDFFMPEHLSGFIEKYRKQMEYKGFMRAIIATMRTSILFDDLGAYEQVGKTDRPVLLIWGKKDKTIPFHHSKEMMRLIPQTQFFPIDNSGHIPHYENPDIVNPIIIDFLNS